MPIDPALLSIIATITLGAISPGPSFIMVAQKSVSQSRRDGLACALGMACGAATFVVLALFGLQAILLAVPSLYLAIKIAGGSYLVYMAIRMWQGATRPIKTNDAFSDKSSLRESFTTGLFTQLSNPKTAITFASTFAAFLPQDFPISQSLILIPVIFLIDFIWYAIVATALSATTPRQLYLKAKKWIDRVAAGLLATLGLKLVIDALSG